MRVLSIDLDYDGDQWEISTHFHKAVFNEERAAYAVWDYVAVPSGLYDAASTLPTLRKALVKCATAVGIVLRPGTLERLEHELALLPLGDQEVVAEQ